MKRLILLATLLAFVLGLAATASAAVDVKASGDWKFAAVWKTGFNNNRDEFNADDASSNFDVWQRLRTYFQFIASENVRGVIGIEMGTGNWGNNGNRSGLGIGTDNTDVIEVKHAYIDFTIPNSDVNVKLGALPLGLPRGYVGNPVLDDDMAAIVVSSPITDNVAILGGWTRPYSDLTGWNDEDGSEEIDAWFAALPMSFDGFSLTPYAMYAYSGENFDLAVPVNKSGTALRGNDDVLGEFDAWWAGFALNLTVLDPFNLSTHFVYGSVDNDSGNDRAGWEADLALSYAGFDFMTPEFFAIYMSGTDGDGDDGRLPIISGGLNVGNFWKGGGFINDKADKVGYGTGAGDTTAGFWGLGLNLKDISFIDKLTHAVGIAYLQGTNDKKVAGFSTSVYGLTLTEDDSLWEFSLKNEYQMYDQLKLVLHLAYLVTDMDSNGIDEFTNSWQGRAEDDIYKVLVGVQYKF